MDIATLKAKGLIGPVRAVSAAGIVFPHGLGVSGLHEVAEAEYGDRAAATGFVLAAARPTGRGILLWISQAQAARDMGIVPEAALQTMASRKLQRLTVMTRHASEAFWAIEEAVTSGAVSHVIAEVETADFTATRRLTLASARHGVPVTLLLPHRTEGATAAATRWRIAPLPSALNRYDPLAPGYARWRTVLERCRTAPGAAGRSFDLEWNDETLSLSVVSGMASGQATPRKAASFHPPYRKAG